MSAIDNMGIGRAGSPVIPLPNPGEGGPVAPDWTVPSTPGANVPVIPLPNPGEGGPVAPDWGVPPGPAANVPVIPLPNPGEGGPVAPGFSGTIITIRPVANPPCFFCGNNANSTAQVRFLNAVGGYQPFQIFIGNRLVVNSLDFGALTTYGRIADGFQIISAVGPDGYIYLQKSLPFRAGEAQTVAIINTASGIDFLQIVDGSCSRPSNMSCLRMCNLAINSSPMDLFLYDGRMVYSDVCYKEVTAFKTIRPGEYQFYIADTAISPRNAVTDIETIGSTVSTLVQPQVLVSFFLNVNANATYTVYALRRDPNSNEVQILIIEDMS